MRWLAFLGLLAGCQLYFDLEPPEMRDAAPDSRPDATLSSYQYVLDRINVPMTNTQAREYGIDLNGDRTVDNQLGMVLSTLNAMGLQSQPAMTAAVDRGEIIHVLALATYDFTDAYEAHATVMVGGAAQPAACADANDTVCRKHLAGTGTFTVDPTNVDLMPGMFTTGTFSGGPGRFALRLVIHEDGNVITLPLIGARAKLSTVTDSSVATAVIAGAVPKTTIDTMVIPAMRDSMEIVVTRDCTMLTSPPACGCAIDSSGKTVLGLFDTTPKDCSVSVAEVQNNSLIVSLLAPDVTIDGQAALSIGVGASAVRATFR